MKIPKGFRRAFRLPDTPPQVERDVSDEIAFHLAMREEKLRAAGVPPDEARRRARERFGDVAGVAEECLTIDVDRARTRRAADAIDSFWQDARYSMRALARTPAFTAAALLTLALGIGATTTMFSVVYGVLLRPLPYAEPERLVQLWETSTSTPGDLNPISVPNFRDWAEKNTSFTATLAYAYNRYTLSGEGSPEQVQGLQVWGDIQSVLGVRPLLGRSIMPGDARDFVVVLSEGLWRRRYGADPGIVGRTIRMHSQTYTVVGVMPVGFSFPRPDVVLWSSYATILNDPAWAEPRGRRFQRAVGRLREDVTIERAAAELDAIAKQTATDHPEANAGGGAAIVPLREQLVGNVRRALMVLFGAVACVLLIACANVAHLLLARTATRDRELAVRAALGASRARIVRQLLTESLVLAVVGGMAGLLLAHLGVTALRQLPVDVLPRLADVRVDGWVVAFSALAITMSGLLVGLASAMRGARRDLGTSMREGGRGAGSARRQRAIQEVLVAAEVAVSLVLVVGAGLLLQSFQRLRTVDPGVEPAGVTTMLVVASFTKYSKPEQQRAIFASIIERVAALPGVSAVGLCDCRPPDEVRQRGSLVLDPAVAVSGERPPVVEQARVGASYFAALGIPVVAGRAFTDADRDGSQPVALVSETLARRHLQGGETGAGALGKRVSLDGENWLTVVGVVADVHYDGLAAPAGSTMYYAFAQHPFPGMFMFVRTSGQADAVVPAIRRAVLEVDPELPLAQVMTLDARVAASITGARFNTTLLAVFASLAFVLAAIGIYGVVAYSVAQRRHEMSVRMALGAQGRDVVSLVVRRALHAVMLGAVLGIGIAIAGAQVLDRMLYATDSGNPATYAGAVLLLVMVGALASYIPGRRAVGDPAAALRAE